MEEVTERAGEEPNQAEPQPMATKAHVDLLVKELTRLRLALDQTLLGLSDVIDVVAMLSGSAPANQFYPDLDTLMRHAKEQHELREWAKAHPDAYEWGRG